MSFKSIEVKLKELGQAQDIKALQAYVTNLEDDKLCSLMSSKMCHHDAPQILLYIFRGLSVSGATEVKRVKLTENVLQELQSRKLNSKQSSLILSRLALELEKFTPVHLVQFTEYCLNCIQDENSDHASWKDLLPKLLSLLVSENAIQHKGVEMSGNEYKSQVVRSLIMLQWQPSTVISLAEMFIDVQLTNEEHLQVVNKFCETLNHLQPQEVPPLVHHLLQLCKSQNGVILFLRLQTYFFTQLYSKLQRDEKQIDDEIESDNEREVRNAAATVLFHVNQAASFGHNSIKGLLKFLKGVSKAPELVLDPFLFTVLLSVSSISIYEEQVLDILKSAVHCSVQEGIKMSESAWLRTLSPSKCNVELMLVTLIDNSHGEVAYILEGLVKLAFMLMGTSAVKGREDAAEKLWGFGSFVLLRLMKKRREVATTVLQLISDRIMSGTAVSQYTACLHQMAISVPHVLNDNRPIITQLLEVLQQLPGAVAEQVVNAMLPVVKHFATFRDVLIMVLRKSLFSRNIETRKMAVLGFLQLLKNLDVSGMAVLSSQSQCSQSNSQRGQTILSQIDWEINLAGNKNNEAVSLEVLGVLRRCFMQQSVVRLSLYKGLLSGVIRNPELSTFVQDMLLNHLSQFYVRDANILPPLHFDKMVAIVNGEAVLQEPVGHLIFVMQQLATHSPCSDDLENILNSLCDRMIKCSLEELGMSENRNVHDISPEAQKQLEVIQQALGALEALIGYCITSCTLDKSQEKIQKLVSLFKMYIKVADYLKTTGKSTKKGDGDGTGNKGAKGNQDKKAANKGKPAKIPDSVLDLQVCNRMLSLLHGNASDWCKADAAAAIKGKREFHKFLLEVTLKLISSVRTSKTALKSKSRFTNYTDIARLLYCHCIIKYSDYSVHDKGNAALALECFNEILSQVISNSNDKLLQFLADLGIISANPALPEKLLVIAKQYQQLLQDVIVQEEENDDSDDPAVKRIPLILLQTLKLVILQLPSNESTSKVLSWIKEYLKEKTLSQTALVKELMCLLFILEGRFKVHSELYHNIAMNICKIIGMVEDGEEIETYIKYAVVREGHQMAILAQLCDAMKRIIENIDWAVLRLKAEQGAISYSADSTFHSKREALKSKEREVVLQVSHSVRVLNYLSSLALEPGTCCEFVLKLLTQQYICLTQITKHFIQRSSRQNPVFQAAKFETVIKLVGKNLSTHVSSLISHIEANQLDESGKKKKKLDPSVLKMKILRETRCIPKLVFEMEQFEKFIIELSKKTKINLMNSVKPSTHRGFRISTSKLIASLDNHQEENDQENTTAEEGQVSDDGASPRKRPRLE